MRKDSPLSFYKDHSIKGCGRIKQKNAERVDKLIRSGDIDVRFQSNVISISDEFVILEQNENKVNLKNDFVFILAGGDPPFALLNRFGIQFGGKSKQS